MGKRKIGKAELKFIIDHYPIWGLSPLGRKLGVDHTTVLHWVRKLRSAGFDLPKPKAVNAEKVAVIEELKKEYGLSPSNPQK